MADIPLVPLAGINNTSEDAALVQRGDNPRVYVREARNVDITETGKASLRPGFGQVTPTPYSSLWQSPLHGDTFGMLGGDLVKVDPLTWTHDALVEVGDGAVSFEVLNNLVCVATPSGIYTYDGQQVRRLAIDTPAPPLAIAGSGSLEPGAYGVAVAWLRGGQESALSGASFCEVGQAGGLDITLPMCFDDSVTGIRLYLTRQNGGEFMRAGDYPLGLLRVSIPLLPMLGRAVEFRHLVPMPSGRFLKYWRGRLLTARANVLRWSQAMAYHLHDERYDFVQMPQRITFVQPVDGGIWVGQVDHVAFLAGNSPDQLSYSRKESRPPVAGSAILLPAEIAGTNASPDGSPVALWLAGNGYVMGNSQGATIEVHAGALKNIAAKDGTTVLLDRRVMTAVT